MLDNIAARRKAFAFVTVLATTFLMLSLIWPLMTRGFVSRSAIGIRLVERPDSAAAFQPVLAEVLRQHTSTSAIASVVRTRNISDDLSPAQREVQADAIRQRLNVNLTPSVTSPTQFSLNLELAGTGTPRENLVVNAMATEIARQFMVSPKAMLTADVSLASAIDTGNLEQRRDAARSRAESLLSQIEGNLAQAHAKLDNSQSAQPTIAASAPRNVFSNASFGTTASPSIRTGIDESTRIASVRDAVNQLASIATEATLAARTTDSGPVFAIEQVSALPARPIGGVPTWRQLVLIGMISTLFAATISFCYRPFTDKGFSNVDVLAKKLGLPVVAKLNYRTPVSDEAKAGKLTTEVSGQPQTREYPVANEIVRWSELVLFGVLISVIAMCMVNTTIRSAFAENPFYGFSRVVWMIRGH